MNKQLIQKFLDKACWDEQCQIELDDVVDLENFAKLIVLECAEWMQSAEDTDGSYIGDSFYWANELKKHFGVE